MTVYSCYLLLFFTPAATRQVSSVSVKYKFTSTSDSKLQIYKFKFK